MRCPSCDCQNPDAAKFCSVCGKPLPLRCPACGATNGEAAKFCYECGAALGGQTPLTVGLPRPPDHEFAIGSSVKPQFIPDIYIKADKSGQLD
jgi:Double zinc ribbon